MKYVLPFLTLLLFTSCDKKKNTDKIKESFDCEFEQIDENMDGAIDDQESELMQLEIDEAYNFKNEIEENLIGEWILVGHAAGFIVTESQPCAYLIIEENELTYKFENATIDSIYTSEWEIKETPTPTFSTFSLQTDENSLPGLRIGVFSPQYMFGSNAAVDGHTYIFKKVN